MEHPNPKTRLTRRIVQLIIVGIIAFIFAYALDQPKPSTSINSAVTFAFMDIGQGDATLITTPHHQHILIDGGPDSTVLTRLGEEMPFHDHTIDLMIATHNHSDHITGLNHVMDRYDVKKMWISGAIHTTNEYLKMLDNIKTHGIPTELAWKGKTADVDSVHLEVVHPIDNMEGQRPEDQHDATIVVRVSYQNTSVLMTGDINEQHEQNIINSGANLQADILKEPHHGSASGLALNFLNAVNPKYAIIQVGKDNKFGHPAQSILDKLNNKGVQIFRNDTQGTIHAYSDGQTFTVKAAK